MAFIDGIAVAQASGDVGSMYEKTQAVVPNYAKVFGHRPQVMSAWSGLLASIRANLDTRRYELITLAAARALRSSYCMLAHGSVLSAARCTRPNSSPPSRRTRPLPTWRRPTSR
jgi:AhpD family alkylhydroperoxidase